MEQPSIQDEKELMDINDDAKTIVEIPRSKKKYKIGYLKSYCTEKVTKIIFYKSVAVIYTGKNNAFLIPTEAMGAQRADILNFIEEMKNR